MTTQEEQATNCATMRHIERVRNLLNQMITQLLHRGELHDQSKLESPEVEVFTKYTHNLAKSDYGSKEYEDCKKEMEVALQHHYAKNRHHPEHHKNGIDDMNLLDLVEMFCDWKAASERHNTGNLKKSIEHNAGHFDMATQLVKIFENTVDLVE